MINKKIISGARECAKRSNMKYRIGSVIFDDDENILSTAFNFCYDKNLATKISNRYFHLGHTKWSVHSETASVVRYIKKYTPYPRGLNIFVFRGNRNGEPRLAKPCSSCSEVIKYVGLKNVEYSK